MEDINIYLKGRKPKVDWGEPCYEADSLRAYCKNMTWMNDPSFVRAYRRGADSGHGWKDIHIEWRVHIILWAASHALRLGGDFVECGVHTGIFSLAACDYLSFEKQAGRKFWLFDTFQGIPQEQMLEKEKEHRSEYNSRFYFDSYERAKANFAPYPNVALVRGMVPDSLSTVKIERVCYLSIDMNIAKPEVAAMEYFWDKLVTGAVVVFDDYGWQNYGEQTRALDAFAASKGVKIATLPTGQGLMIKS